jgi:hypothetical protein
MDGKDPGEVIQSRRADVHQWDDLFLDAMLKRMLIHRCVHAGQSFGHLDAEILRQRDADHVVALIDLVAQPDGFDPRVTVDRVADADHRIGEVDEPCLWAGFFHVARDLQDGTDVARRVRKSAGSAVLGIRLAHAVFEGNFEIPLPQVFTRADLDGVDDEMTAGQRLAMIWMCCDDELRIPFTLSLSARRWTISRLSAFRSTSASVEPRNFFERMMADKRVLAKRC